MAYLAGPPTPGAVDNSAYYQYPQPAAQPNVLQRVWNLLSGADNPPDTFASGDQLNRALGNTPVSQVLFTPGQAVSNAGNAIAGALAPTSVGNIGKDLLILGAVFGGIFLLEKVA